LHFDLHICDQPGIARRVFRCASLKGTKTLRPTFSGAMSLNATRYRYYLVDARQHADQATDPAEKEAWLQMAQRWLRLLVLADPQAVVVSTTNRGMERLTQD